MSLNHGLTSATVADIHSVLARHPEVERAVLYGSRAKGNYKPGSDVDLTLVGAELTPKILGKIERDFDDGPLPYRFDLSIFSQITQADILEDIQRVGVVFYERTLDAKH